MSDPGNTQADQEDAKLYPAKEGKRERQRIEGEAWVSRFFLPCYHKGERIGARVFMSH